MSAPSSSRNAYSVSMSSRLRARQHRWSSPGAVSTCAGPAGSAGRIPSAGAADVIDELARVVHGLQSQERHQPVVERRALVETADLERDVRDAVDLDHG